MEYGNKIFNFFSGIQISIREVTIFRYEILIALLPSEYTQLKKSIKRP